MFLQLQSIMNTATQLDDKDVLNITEEAFMEEYLLLSEQISDFKSLISSTVNLEHIYNVLENDNDTIEAIGKLVGDELPVDFTTA